MVTAEQGPQDPQDTLSPLRWGLHRDQIVCSLGRRLLTQLVHLLRFLNRVQHDSSHHYDPSPEPRSLHRTSFLGSLQADLGPPCATTPQLGSLAPLLTAYDRVTASKDVHPLIPQTCEYVTYHDKSLYKCDYIKDPKIEGLSRQV